MEISRQERDMLIKELMVELGARPDGGGKNLIAQTCPYCGKGGEKFGIYIGPETGKKKLFMSHCFKCGHTTTDVNQLLEDIGRPDLMMSETADLSFTPDRLFFQEDEEEINDELIVIDMPDGWKRCFRNPYLNERGFELEDYEYFQVGTTRGLNFKFDNYVVFPVIDNGDIVGYVSRHIWTKDEIDEYNRKARRAGKYEIRRYNNSPEDTGNEFIKLLYNYDSIVEDETDTVIIVEGIFDVIALTRKLDLYENNRIAVVATFGKKVSPAQIYKLQSKGVRTVILGYDGDSVETMNKIAGTLDEYFDTYIAYIADPEADFDSMNFWEIYDTFSVGLMTPIEYKLKVVQL